MNKFLFIIPLTPSSHLTELRIELQKLCFESLLNQNYTNWKTLIIGEDKPLSCIDQRFIHIKVEGPKELKLQFATKYIKENKVEVDYIIRLDDDDMINPTILDKLKNTQADAIVDLNHWFIEWETKIVSNEFRPWFPNSFFIKKDHALAKYGELTKKNIEIINESVSLIENSHASMHNFFIQKQVLFISSSSPIYLRVLNRDSITSNAGQTYEAYLSQYGNWSNSIPQDFQNIDKSSKELKWIKKGFYKKMKNKVYLHFSKKKFLKLFKAVHS